MRDMKDFEDLSKDDLIQNLRKALDNIERLEEENHRFEATEKERMRLLNENQELKKELGLLKFVKSLLEKAEIYGYEDWLKITASTGGKAK